MDDNYSNRAVITLQGKITFNKEVTIIKFYDRQSSLEHRASTIGKVKSIGKRFRKFLKHFGEIFGHTE